MKKIMMVWLLLLLALPAWAGPPVVVGPDDTAYNATTWDGSVKAPTQNAVRDKVEALSSSAAITGGAIDGTTVGLTTPAAGTFTDLLGKAVFVAVDSSRAITAAEMLGQTLKVSGAYTPTLPTAAVGYRVILEATTAAVYSVDLAAGSDIIELAGTTQAAGEKITSSGAKRARVLIYCETAGTYIAIPLNDVFINGGA